MTARREVLKAFAALAAGAPLRSFAQRKVPLIGYLSPVVPQNNTDFRLEAFRQGMRELGYVEGENYRLELRWGEGKLERMPALAAELVKLKPDLIVGASSPAYLAAKDATHAIPIVAPVMSDPVGDGLVTSLARPGGNLTGISLMAPELGGKRLQMLSQILAKRAPAVGVMWNPAYKGMGARFKDTEATATSAGYDIRSIEVRDAREMEAAFDAVKKNRPDGLLLLADPLTLSLRLRIVEFARENRLPAIYEIREFAEAGGLMSYGANLQAQFRHSAAYVDRILKGAKAGELPIEQPTRLELVINLGTARALGLMVPKALLESADQVIE